MVFCFHAFHTFPVEVRRMLLDLGLRVPIVGYTHGSHWDVTDTYRSDHYPGLALADFETSLPLTECWWSPRGCETPSARASRSSTRR